MPRDEIDGSDYQCQENSARADHGGFPVQLRKLKHDEIQYTPALLHGNGFRESFILAQLGFETGHDLRDVQPQQRGITAHEAADIHCGRESVEPAFLECLQIIAADFRCLGGLGQAQVLGLACLAKLVGNC